MKNFKVGDIVAIDNGAEINNNSEGDKKQAALLRGRNHTIVRVELCSSTGEQMVRLAGEQHALYASRFKLAAHESADFRVVGKKPQTTLILEHLREKGSISAVEAWTLYSVRSLSRRIVDLKGRGHKFNEVTSKAPNGQRYVRYHWLGKGDVKVAA